MRARDLASLTRRLARALGPYKKLCVLGFGALVVDVVYGAVAAMSFAWLVDRAIVPRDSVVLWQILAVLAAGVIVASVVGIAMDHLQSSVGARVANDARQELFAKLCDMSVADATRLNPGDAVVRFSTDLTAIEVTVGGALPGLVRAVLAFVIGLTLLFVLDVKLGAISALLLPLCLAYPRVLARRAATATEERRAAESVALGAVEEALDNQEAIKALALEPTLVASFLDKTADIVARSVRGTFLSTLVPRSSAIGVNVLELGLVALLALFAFRGEITIGTIVSFHALFIQTSLALLAVTQIGPTVVNGAVGFQRIDEMLAWESAVVDAPGATDAPELSRRVDFFDVRFGYDPDFPVIEDVSFSIGAGEAVAIVGPSGSGKSTLAQLLLRFYDPDRGEVRFDGANLCDVTQRSLRAQIGFVTQSPVVFDATLRENVRFGRLDATDAEVEAACRAAGVHAFVADLPARYETLIGSGGVALSGGQLQRVALARALVRDPAILLLDEPTSALDPATEAAVMATLAKARRGRTLIVVTHRLTTITDFDRILVMNEGRIVEDGHHEALLRKGGLYTRLWGAQGVQIVPREIRGPSSRRMSRPPPSLTIDAQHVQTVSIRPGRF